MTATVKVWVKTSNGQLVDVEDFSLVERAVKYHGENLEVLEGTLATQEDMDKVSGATAPASEGWRPENGGWCTATLPDGSAWCASAEGHRQAWMKWRELAARALASGEGVQVKRSETGHVLISTVYSPLHTTDAWDISPDGRTCYCGEGEDLTGPLCAPDEVPYKPSRLHQAA